MEELKKEPVTVFLILVNALVFLVVEFTGGSEDTLHMLQCGAAYTPSILDGEYFRILTCMFRISERSIWEIICWCFLFWEEGWNVLWDGSVIF